MSFARTMRRAKARKNGNDWPTRERPYRDSKRAQGYDTLHPTKGWKRIGAKRLRAQARISHMIERIAARKRRRS